MGIQQRGNSWRTRYYGPDGRQRSKSFRRKSDAERWLSQQRSFIAQGDWTDPARGRITFGEYALAWQAGQQVSRVTRSVVGNSLTLRTAHRSSRHSSILKHPLACGSASGSPSPASNATSTWRFTASWLTTTTAPPLRRRAMSVSPLTARFRTADRGSTPGARSTEPHRAVTASRLMPVQGP